MHISYRWLARHLDLSGHDPASIARDLTLHVAEVEGFHRFAPALDVVVVGQVLSREPHPDADRLSLCQVDLGDGPPRAIVCGAANVAAGQTVAVAPVGALLPGDIEIRRAKIRGQVSEGMICSERELGVSDEQAGIWELPAGLGPGQTLTEALGGADWVFEIENKAITHRPDLWAHRGLAAELAALWGRPLLPMETRLPATGEGPDFAVRIATPHCPRYLALPIDGVRAERSPEWLRLLLLATGQRPIDQLVDVSNFVMLDLGQPNHLFDRDRVAGGIEVREARQGETMRTLDGESRSLQPGDVLICSDDQPVALGGVMGGEGSKVAADTRRLLLEVANFDAAAIRATAARLGLRTDASARFEKALDPGLPLDAAGHLVRLLSELQPGLTLPAAPTDIGTWRDPAMSLAFRPERARALLGIPLTDRDIARYLERLGFGIEGEGATWQVRVPSWRATGDVSIEEDLIEEVGRLHGYENIAEQPIRADLSPALPDRRRAVVRAAQDSLSGGPAFNEALTYSFIAEPVVRAIGAESEPYTEVVNAIAAGLDRIRRDIVPSLLGLVEPNLRHAEELRLFEIGKGSRVEDKDDWGKPAEVHQIGLVWSRPAAGTGAAFDDTVQLRLKGVVEQLLSAIDAPPPTWRPAAAASRPSWAHPGRSALAMADGPAGEVPLAFLGDIDPLVARRLGWAEGRETAAASIDIDVIVGLPIHRRVFKDLPRYPGVKIDVALAVDSTLPASELEAAVRRAGGDQVAKVELFDLYGGAQLGQGRKSLAYHVLLQSDSRTLSDADGQRFLAALEQEAARLGAELRRA